MLEAGEAIMDVRSKGFSTSQKNDGSPVTDADKKSENIVLSALSKLEPEIPIISEENPNSHSSSGHQIFFLIDPLDGTREFLKSDKDASFTVNIGLISDGKPIMGLIYAPAQNRLFSGVVGNGSYEHKNDQMRKIEVSHCHSSDLTALASISHRDEETNHWLIKNEISKTISIGSSLKFCLLAAGEANVYPRFGPTMEWDTAAGDAILRAAGGNVTHPDGHPFTYGKPGYKNGPFIACGGITPEMLKAKK